jgi:flagellar FliL protein
VDAIPLTPPLVAFSDVPDILVNIQSSDGTPAYLKLSLSLEMDNDLEKAGITALTPRLVDQFQSYLRELRVDDLKGSEGVLRLKEELLRRVNAASAPYHVRDVLLKQMIVQ